LAAPAAETKQAGRAKGHTDHLSELWPVTMPAYPCAPPIFVDQDVLEPRLIQSGEGRRLRAKGQKEIRDRRAPLEPALACAVSPAERDRPPIGEEAAEFVGPKIQASEALGEVTRLLRRDELGLVAKAFGQVGRRRSK
jgi:hypothetical protein